MQSASYSMQRKKKKSINSALLFFVFFSYLDEEINTLEIFRKERAEGISGQTTEEAKITVSKVH